MKMSDLFWWVVPRKQQQAEAEASSKRLDKAIDETQKVHNRMAAQVRRETKQAQRVADLAEEALRVIKSETNK